MCNAIRLGLEALDAKKCNALQWVPIADLQKDGIFNALPHKGTLRIFFRVHLFYRTKRN